MYRFLKPERFDLDPASTQHAANQWMHWKRTFENFLQESEDSLEVETKLSDAVKLRLLVNHISPTVYEYIINCSTYTSAIFTLEKIYVKPISEIYARHKLTTRIQQAGESIDQFIQALKLLAKECNFKSVSAEENENDSIRGAFIAGMSSSHIRQRLLENATLTLDEAYVQARAIETAQVQSESFSSHMPIVNNAIRSNMVVRKDEA